MKQQSEDGMDFELEKDEAFNADDGKCCFILQFDIAYTHTLHVSSTIFALLLEILFEPCIMHL